jgi:hypothetical protein
MGQHFDLAKFVGAASAPVALIIATSIFLSNLTTKWWAVNGTFRGMAGELRALDDQRGSRSESLQRQLVLVAKRLHLLMTATTLLTLAILSFILPVVLTGVSIIGGGKWIEIATVFASFAGFSFLAASVIVESWENHLGRGEINLEIKDYTHLADSEPAERPEHAHRY